MIAAEEERAEGGTYYDFTYNGSGWDAVPIADQDLGAPQLPEDSGEDWYYGHCNITEAGAVVGVLGIGYNTWPNWSFEGNGCEPPMQIDSPIPEEFETANHRKSRSIGYLAAYDLDGEEQWSRHLLPGLLRTGIQDADGNLLVVGNAYSNRWVIPLDPGDNSVIRLNQTTLDMNNVDCNLFTEDHTTKGYITKMAPDGTILWTTMCNGVAGANQAQHWRMGSFLTDIVELSIPGTNIRYCAVGRTNVDGAMGVLRPLVVYLDVNGQPLERYTYAPNAPAGWMSEDLAEFVSVAVQLGKLFITGYSTAPTGPAQLIGTLVDANTNRSGFIWQRYTGNPGDPLVGTGANDHHIGQVNNSTGGGFLPNVGGVKILWPTLANFSQGTAFGGVANVGTLLVHGLNENGSIAWTTDLGEVRAYDLKSEMVPTSDGMAAIVSSKLSMDQAALNPPFGWDNLDPAEQQCLNTTYGASVPFGGADWDGNPSTNPGSTTDPAGIYGYWNTDAYVAKLNPNTGALLWETQFDAHPGVLRECPLADMRKQECMYQITETDDGGLVISGNTSDNFDDFYLAKLKGDCQSAANYANSPVLDGNNEHHVTGSTTWNTSRNVHGRIIVDNGATLTIGNGAVISFADTRQLDHPTTLEVRPGGKLVVNGNAKLTAMAQCPGSVWDGIQVHGIFAQPQDPVTSSPQGLATFTNATIEHARVAVLTAKASTTGDFPWPILKSSTGGIVRATSTTFHNNRMDVDFRPYENHELNPPDQIANNRSFFTLCHFTVDAQLPDGSMPLEHASLATVRGIPFRGCTFAGVNYVDLENAIVQSAGTGVKANNSSFLIGSKCTVLVPWGTPCPAGNYFTTSFTGLAQGVHAASLDPGKTFSVDEATFTDCPRGIRMEGVDDAAITRNNFSVDDFTGSYYQFATPYGIYSDQCTGYKIENNVLSSASHSGAHAQAGMVIKDSGPYSNTIYNNRFDGFYDQNSTALLIQGLNGDPHDYFLTGLEVRCNEFGQHGADNRFDVALTGSSPKVRANQGRVFSFATDFTAPAGNLFSLLGQVESDWHVGGSSNFVNYFHHSGTNQAWVPQFYDQTHFLPTDALGQWPSSRSQACPDHFQDGVVELQQMQAEAVQQDAQLQADQQAYDATKDNGDTYSLMSYVENPANSDVQVRNALQSVAPSAGTEVWQAVFARQPAMDPWYLTQALLANSPLQPEVMDLCYNSALDDFYYFLVLDAQSGVNVLSGLESTISSHAGGKARAVTDLGRMSWLDSTAVDSAITALLAFHDSLPSENNALVQAGWYMAKNQPLALQALAEHQLGDSLTDGLYSLWKRYAQAEQAVGWQAPDSGTVAWLEDLAQDRWTIGSAQASAWLQALGGAPLEELILLPTPGLKNSRNERTRQRANSAAVLHAWPNPSSGPVYVLCNVPANVGNAMLRIIDLNGRLVQEMALAAGSGITEIKSGFAAAGIYLAELRLDGIRAGQVKLVLQ